MTPERLEHTPRSKQRAAGQATVELALVGTFLVLLLAGIADVARIFSEHLAVVHAAAVGARWATLDKDYKACSGYTDFRTPVVEDLAQVVPASRIVSIVTSTTTNPATYRVDVTYRHDYLFGLISNVSTEFTGGATMPGDSLAPGVCPTPLATSTPTVTPTGTPTATPTPCTGGYTVTTTARYYSNSGSGPAKVTVVVAQGSVSLITGYICNNPGCPGTQRTYLSFTEGPPGTYNSACVGNFGSNNGAIHLEGACGTYDESFQLGQSNPPCP